MEINIETAVRICPIPYINGNNILCIQPNTTNNTIQLLNSQSFPVSYALPVDCCQNTLYTSIATPLLNYLLEGCDVSIVALGQTGTGKTYTLYGPGFHFAASESDQGIIPRFIREMFTKLKQHRDRNWSVHITWSQICGETVQDLLGAGTVECTDVLEAFQLIQVGLSNTAPKCSHTLFTITLDQQWVVDSSVQHQVSTASFADLAGSEKVMVYDNNGLVQSIPTDSGLLALQQCITSLSEPYHSNYSNINNVPYGQSVLTTLLKDSFGGRAKTVLISCASSLLEDYAETLYTLQLALRSQTIKNIVTINSYTTFQTSSETYDVFGLQFAANQLFKLVSNAEELFQKLICNSSLPKGDLDQITQWLTFKQECEECLSENSEPHRSLDIIEEEEMEDNYCSGTSDSEDLIDEENDHCHNMLDKLDLLMKNFKINTDTLVAEAYNENMTVVSSAKESFCSSSTEYHLKGARGRRGSIHSAAELPNSLSTESKFAEETASDTEEKVIENNSLSFEMKKKHVKHIATAIQGYQKQISDLQKTIQVKEKLMQQLMKNKAVNSNVQLKLEQKCHKLLADYETAMAAFSHTHHAQDIQLEEKCNNKLSELERKLNDAESLKSISEESKQKLMEIENSLHTSKKQLDKLKRCKRKEEKRKYSYETQIKEEKKKIMNSIDSNQSLEKPKINKVTNSDDRKIVAVKNTDIMLTNENIESLRHEIRNLRKTREILLEQRCKIDTKSQNKKFLNDIDERKLLQYEEAIEAIDLAIEYKNEILCGRIPVIAKHLEQLEEQTDRMLIDRLMKLDSIEMRILLHKYFQKVVDLRNNTKKLEVQVVDIENRNENLSCRVQTLSQTLQQVRLESERRILALQQQHEDKLQLVMRHLASDGDDRVVAKVSKQATLAVQMPGTSKPCDKSLIARFTRIARQETLPRQLQMTVSIPQAKVTRQKNKLFIQQTPK